VDVAAGDDDGLVALSAFAAIEAAIEAEGFTADRRLAT
jgi:hypothetical protein